MKPEIQLMHEVWDVIKIEDRSPTDLPSINFDEIVSSVFTTGPFYYYIIDFFDLSISHLSSGFVGAHGLEVTRVKTINDILNLIHPDDMAFVSKAEKKTLDFIYGVLGAEKITSYKASYNFRFRTGDGSYSLYNHQSLILTVDKNNNFIKSLNIHTNISHLTKKNNYKVSLIGLRGEPSYLNLDPLDTLPGTESDSSAGHVFTKREIEIIRLLAEGFDTKQIAEKLFISPATAETHRKNILRKAGCRNSAKLVARSMSEGWI